MATCTSWVALYDCTEITRGRLRFCSGPEPRHPNGAAQSLFWGQEPQSRQVETATSGRNGE